MKPKKTGPTKNARKLSKSDDSACLNLHPSLKNYLGYCFVKSAHRVRACVDRALAPFGVVAPQFGILVILDESGPMTQIELGSLMAMDKATMVRMIDCLEGKGMVTRATSRADRRAKQLAVTPLGVRALRKMDLARRRGEDRVFSKLTPGERTQLARVLEKLL